MPGKRRPRDEEERSEDDEADTSDEDFIDERSDSEVRSFSYFLLVFTVVAKLMWCLLLLLLLLSTKYVQPQCYSTRWMVHFGQTKTCC